MPHQEPQMYPRTPLGSYPLAQLSRAPRGLHAPRSSTRVRWLLTSRAVPALQLSRMPPLRPPPGHSPPPGRRALRAGLPRVMPPAQRLKVRRVVVVARDDVVHVCGRRCAPRPSVPQDRHALEAVPLQDGQAADRPVRGKAGAPVAGLPGHAFPRFATAFYCRTF